MHVDKFFVTMTLITIISLSLIAVIFSMYNTQQHTLNLAVNLCLARNASVRISNIRWANEKDAWLAAYNSRIYQAKVETDSKTKATYLESAATYKRVADSIVPYKTVDCQSP